MTITSSASGSPLHQSRQTPGTPEVEQQWRWSLPEIEMNDILECLSTRLSILGSICPVK